MVMLGHSLHRITFADRNFECLPTLKDYPFGCSAGLVPLSPSNCLKVGHKILIVATTIQSAFRLNARAANPASKLTKQADPGNLSLRNAMHLTPSPVQEDAIPQRALQFVELGETSTVRPLKTASASADWAKYSFRETKVHLAARSAW